MLRKFLVVGIYMALSAGALTASAQAPPAPSLIAPAAGAAVVQPVTLSWSSVVDPAGPIGTYTWEVSATSTFASVIASGFTTESGDPNIPTRTQDKVSGLPNGTYFWHVKATAIVGGVVFSVDSPWSAPQTFTIIGLGAAPGTPTFTSPANGAQFHALEFFMINWTAPPGAHHYMLEADDEPTFSYPLALTLSPMQFGTSFHAGWGNEIPNIYYRIVAVAADGTRGLPSPTLNVHITNLAPVAPPPVPLFPVGGAAVTLPFTLDWTDTQNPQVAGYDVDIDTDPNFAGAIGVLFVQGVSRSDYMVVPDPAVQGFNIFPPGTYFWRVRAEQGAVLGPWSPGQSFTVLPSPATPPGLLVDHILNEPSAVSGGNSTQARVTLNSPAPAGGALVNIATDMPFDQTPTSVLVPEGKTDAIVTPISTTPVGGTTVGSVRAAYGIGWQDNSLALFPIYWGLSFDHEGVVGGTPVQATLNLIGPAPAGGVTVALVDTDSSLLSLPATVTIPAGGTGATFTVPTSPVSVPVRVIVDSGTPFEGYHAPSTWLTLNPPGTPAPPPSLSSLTLAPAKILGEGTTTGTVTLTGPAPAGGALVRLSGSMEGVVVTPPSVTVPAGSLSATFPITVPQVNAPRFVFIQGSYGTTGGNQAQLLEVDPGPPGAAVLFSFGIASTNLIGGASTRGTASLVMLAPAGGGAVALTSTDPSVQVPPSVAIAAGNSANSFNITTSPVFVATTVRVDATAGGVTKSQFINLGPNPNAPPLLSSVSMAAPSVTGGNSITGTVFLSAPAPAGGATVTLSTSNLVAKPQPIVTVPTGATSATFTVTTSAVTANTPITITAIFAPAAPTTTFTVLASAAPPPPNPGTPATPSLLSPADRATVAQPILFDWNDAANAATYLIQVSTSNNFNPVTASQTVSVSQATISGLPAQQLFWRVRGINSAGTTGAFSASRRFTAQAGAPPPPPPPPAAALSGVSVSPTAVVGGSPSQGTVTLTSGAPAGGAVVTLSSSNAAATVPASVTVAAGATSAPFSITTTTVAAATAATISASFGGLTRTAALTVNPVAAAPALSTLTLNPTSVVGGAGNSTGTATLTAAAPAGGAIVTLSSSNATAAGVPTSVTVAAGATSATFTVTTTTVAAATSVTITGAFGGATQTATLTVNPVPPPPPPPPPPGATATLTVTATGRGGERVSSSPAGISVAVGSTGSATFTTGTSITLSATNTRDVIWSGACSSGGAKAKTCTFTLSAAASVTANVQ